MSEVTDIVVPILQRLKTDVGDLKRNSDKADLDRQGRSLLEVARRVETLEQKT